MGLTRRAFVRRSAAATLLAATAGWPSGAEAAAGLRKCVAMDSLNHGGDVEDLRVNGNLEKLLALGTRWVRIWIRWDKAQLYPPAFVPMTALDRPVHDAAICGPANKGHGQPGQPTGPRPILGCEPGDEQGS